MTFIDAIVLGIIQGITEFLPISSSGHLVVGQYVLGIVIPGNAFEVIVHVGTLLSILVVFWKDLLHLLTTLNTKETQKYIIAIFIGTIPAVLAGFFLKENIENAFDNIHLVSGSLIFTGIILILTKWASVKKDNISVVQGLCIGIAQACAIIPGISRSGSTIGMGLLLGLDPKKTARFSFIMAIPVLFGSGLLTAIDAVQSDEQALSLSVMLGGFFSSFLVGWVALNWLIKVLQKGKFYWFGLYCLALGIGLFIILNQ